MEIVELILKIVFKLTHVDNDVLLTLELRIMCFQAFLNPANIL